MTELYKNVEGADINAELTADLVGDYLFQDNDFIMNLSTKNRNVFQKIYDELKRLLKIVTPGTKEAKQLDEVKRAFDKAYKAGGKATGDTKYSISEAEQQQSDARRTSAVEKFGTTREIDRAGFVMPDGRMLNMSRGYGFKGVNHNAIESVFENEKGELAINKFIQEGNIRIKAEAPGIEIGESVAPAEGQVLSLRKFINSCLSKNDTFYLDITGKDGKEIASVTYYADDSDVNDIMYDIEKYYEKGRIPTSDTGAKYSLAEGVEQENSDNSIDKYSQKHYNRFGWAREEGAITKNELDDMYSKIHEKGSLKKFPQTSSGEAIIEVNDNPHTTLGVDNVFVFATGTKNNPQISRVVRFQAETDTEMEIIKEKLYERGSFSNSYYSYLKQYGLATEYRRESALDYIGYKEKVRGRIGGAESNRANRNIGIEQNRSGTPKQTQSNEISPIKEVSSKDGAFFDGKKPKSSLTAEGDTPKKYGDRYTPATELRLDDALPHPRGFGRSDGNS